MCAPVRRVLARTRRTPPQSCYTGYPKRDFPTKSMQARATPLPDKNKTLTIQVDNGDVYVFVTTEDGPSQKKLVSLLKMEHCH